jgi:hypothetical protein
MHHADEDWIDSFILANETLYEDTSERARHVSVVKSLAKDMDEPVDEVAQTYETLLEQYKQNAQILDYLPVLVSKKVKEFYRTHYSSI